MSSSILHISKGKRSVMSFLETMIIPACVLLLKLTHGSSLSYRDASHDSVLAGSVFESPSVDNYEQCYRLCHYSTVCRSVNWYPGTKLCELNSEMSQTLEPAYGAPARQPASLESNACIPNPCEDGQTCITVTATEAFLCAGPLTTSPTTVTTTSTATTPMALTPGETTTTTSTATTPMTLTPGETTTTTSTVTTPMALTPGETTTTTSRTTTTTTTITTTTTSISTTTTTDCSPLTDKFSVSEGGIRGYDAGPGLSGLTVEECIAQCVSATDYVCRSFDYWLSGSHCWHKAGTKDDVPVASVFNSVGFAHYRRLNICEVSTTTPEVTTTTPEITTTTPEVTTTTPEVTTITPEVTTTTPEVTTTTTPGTTTPEVTTTTPEATTTTTPGTTTTMDCTILSNNFSMTSGYAISQHNNEELSDISVDDCKQRCLAATQYTCRSFDVRPSTKECLTSAESRATVPAEKFRPFANYDYYERLSICDVELQDTLKT